MKWAEFMCLSFMKTRDFVLKRENFTKKGGHKGWFEGLHGQQKYMMAKLTM